LPDLVAEGTTLEEALAATAVAVGALLRRGSGATDRVPLLIEADDVESLATGFVEDILYLAQFEQFTIERVERIQIRGAYLRAAVSGRSGAAAHVDCESVQLDRSADLWQLRVRLSEPSAAQRA
jgi:SHS2 domain-containing protein